MVKSLSLNILKNKKAAVLVFRRVLAILCLLLSNNSFSQSILNQTSPEAVKTPFTEVASIDRLNNIYLTDRKNNLHKFDPTGKLVTTFSPPGAGHIALVDAWNTAKILLFYDDQQTITFLDRFLAPIATTRLSDFVDGLVKTASFSGDNRIWAFNESNFSLHKIDVQYPESSRIIPLDLLLNKQQYDIRFVREYQNNVYLVDRLSGIYVFDNLGNYQKKLPYTGLSYINFRGDELYYLNKGKIHYFHLYTLQERITDLAFLGALGTYRQVLIGETNLYLISEKGLEVKPIK